MSVIIYHNPKCSKSRETLKILENKGITFEIKLYLDSPPDNNELKDIINKLGFSSAKQLMREKEDIYKELNLTNEQDENTLIQAMINNPILIERPIVINNDKSKIGRPPESVLELF